MTRLTYFLACVVGLAALTAGSARAEYDSGGTPTNPAQIQANRPQTVMPIESLELRRGVFLSTPDGKIIQLQPAVPIFLPRSDTVPGMNPADLEELTKLIQALQGLQPIAHKPAPAKKPLPKPQANARPVIGRY